VGGGGEEKKTRFAEVRGLNDKGNGDRGGEVLGVWVKRYFRQKVSNGKVRNTAP